MSFLVCREAWSAFILSTLKELPMKALIMTLGTRGDVQPFVALTQERGLDRAVALIERAQRQPLSPRRTQESS